MQNLYDNIDARAKEIVAETTIAPIVQVEQKANLSQLIESPAFLGQASPLSKTSEFLAAATGWVYAATSVISDEVANIKLRLLRVKKDSTEEVVDSPILDLLFRANDFTTKFDLFWQTQNYLELTGEAPWFIAKEDAGQPSDIVLLRPDLLTVIPGKGDNFIEGYSYRIDGNTKVALDADEVIFIRYPDPIRRFRGKGTLQAAAKTVDIDNFSENWNRNFYFNSAVPGSILKTDQKITTEVRDFIDFQLRKIYKGTNNAHKTMILEQGLEWQPLSLSQKDMDFLEQQKFSRDKILGIFRVPRTAIGITDDVNRANAEATDFVFAKRTIKPKMQRLIEQLNEFFLPMFTGSEDLILDFVDPIPEDVETKLKIIDSGLKTGWLTINEVREQENLPSIGEAGDLIRLPLNLQPIDGTAEEPADEKSVHYKQILRSRNRKKIVSEKRNAIIQAEIEKKILPAIKSQLESDRKKFISDDPINQKFWEIKVAMAEAFEKKAKEKMRMIFERQKKDTVERLNKKAVLKEVKKWLLPVDKETQKTKKSFKPLIAAVIKEESANSFSLLGLEDELSLSNPAVEKYLENETFRFAEQVTRETNKKLGKSLSNGVAKGESIAILSSRVNKIFNKMKRSRAERIARTEVLRASNFATQQSYEESGVVEEKTWMTAFDERVCEFCGPLDGKTISLRGNFFNKGGSLVGTDGGTLNFKFSGVPVPPLHPNCRCTIIPVVK